MKSKTVTWQMEYEALFNALRSNKLDGYEIRVQDNNDARKKTTFYLIDDTKLSITGCWSYEKLNHFIMGYGKAMKKINAATESGSNMHPIFTEALKPFGIK